jgi:hypothetical protein
MTAIDLCTDFWLCHQIPAKLFCWPVQRSAMLADALVKSGSNIPHVLGLFFGDGFQQIEVFVNLPRITGAHCRSNGRPRGTVEHTGHGTIMARPEDTLKDCVAHPTLFLSTSCCMRAARAPSPIRNPSVTNDLGTIAAVPPNDSEHRFRDKSTCMLWRMSKLLILDCGTACCDPFPPGRALHHL